MLVPMSLQLFWVGQMDYLFLGLVVLIVWAASRKNDVLVALVFPFLLTKPHLIVPFTAFLFWRLGKRALLWTTISTGLLLILATILMPQWYLEMSRCFAYLAQERLACPLRPCRPCWGARRIGWEPRTCRSRRFSLCCRCFFCGERELPTMPLLSFALALSLFCAPRAYAYDLPLIIPAMVWLTASRFPQRAWMWAAAALIPIATWFSSAAYLLTLLICLLATRQATLETAQVTSGSIAATRELGPE